MNCIVDIVKLIGAMFCIIVFAVFAFLFAMLRLWIPFVIVLLLLIVYILAGLKNGRVIRVDEHGVRMIFPRKANIDSWDTIKEVGIAGIKVINGNKHNAKKKNFGSVYIYFSKTQMTEHQLFNMCLEWPPKDILYIRYSLRRAEAVQRYWVKSIKTYNVDDLPF